LSTSREDGKAVCRQAYSATDVRHSAVLSGLDVAKQQLRQLLQDVTIIDPTQAAVAESLVHGVGGGCAGAVLDLSSHRTWASASPLVRNRQ
jgi:hypothetical protein